MSQLAAWFRELRDAGKSEVEALRVIAARIHESPLETRRILTSIAGVSLSEGADVGDGRRSTGRGDKGGSAEKPAQANGGGPRGELDVSLVEAKYRSHRRALDSEKSIKAIARELDERPHNIRKLCGVVELELRREREAV